MWIRSSKNSHTDCCCLLLPTGWVSWQTGKARSSTGPTVDQKKLNSTVTPWTGSDFNINDIDWEKGVVKENSKKESVCEWALNIINYSHLTAAERTHTTEPSLGPHLHIKPVPAEVGPHLHIKPVPAEVNRDCTRHLGPRWNIYSWLLPANPHQQEDPHSILLWPRINWECYVRGIKGILYKV